jgi:cellulose synthase/poly-beta-1,6-N-acetylglucosamine synthase-like glycosyltransferase
MFNYYSEFINIKIKIFVKIFLFIALLFIFIIVLIVFKHEQILIKKTDDYKNEINRIEKYKHYCEKGSLIHFSKSDKPKISIVSPVFNRGKYILRFIRSIQNQFFNDTEIIFVDDFSNDNTKEIIENLQKIDERIILIKNKKNKGTLISRNNGALKSKGEFLIFPDPDDLLSDDILNYCYIKAKTYSYDLIKFNLYSGNKVYNLKKIKNIQNKEIYQKELNLIKKIRYSIFISIILKIIFTSNFKNSS